MRTKSATHRHIVGDLVTLDFDDGQHLSQLNPFTVEAQLPPVGTALQYRLKSAAETCRRVVPEHRLRSLAFVRDVGAGQTGLLDGLAG